MAIAAKTSQLRNARQYRVWLSMENYWILLGNYLARSCYKGSELPYRPCSLRHSPLLESNCLASSASLPRHILNIHSTSLAEPWSVATGSRTVQATRVRCGPTRRGIPLFKQRRASSHCEYLPSSSTSHRLTVCVCSRLGRELKRPRRREAVSSDNRTASVRKHADSRVTSKATRSKPRKKHAKSFHGCSNCRRRHIKCDEAYPQW